MNSNKPHRIIINQLKRIKCFECNCYLKFNKSLSYTTSFNFKCNCGLFNYIFYIYFKDAFSNTDYFYIRNTNSDCCIISISKTYEVCVFEDINNAFTKDIIEANEVDLFKILNINLQSYSKIQKNLLFT